MDYCTEINEKKHVIIMSHAIHVFDERWSAKLHLVYLFGDRRLVNLWVKSGWKGHDILLFAVSKDLDRSLHSMQSLTSVAILRACNKYTTSRFLLSLLFLSSSSFFS